MTTHFGVPRRDVALSTIVRIPRAQRTRDGKMTMTNTFLFQHAPLPHCSITHWRYKYQQSARTLMFLFLVPRYMRVQRVAITVGHKCTAPKKVALYNKECGKCTVSVDGGVLMIYVNMNRKSKLQFWNQPQLVQRSSPPSRIVKLLTDIRILMRQGAWRLPK